MAVCMLTLCDRLSRHKEELEGLHLAHCAQIEALSSPGLPLGFMQSLPILLMHFIRLHLSCVFLA